MFKVFCKSIFICALFVPEHQLALKILSSLLLLLYLDEINQCCRTNMSCKVIGKLKFLNNLLNSLDLFFDVRIELLKNRLRFHRINLWVIQYLIRLKLWNLEYLAGNRSSLIAAFLLIQIKTSFGAHQREVNWVTILLECRLKEILLILIGSIGWHYLKLKSFDIQRILCNILLRIRLWLPCQNQFLLSLNEFKIMKCRCKDLKQSIASFMR